MVGVLAVILLVMFIVYRMRKKDEGSYALDEPKQPPHYSYAYQKSPTKEFYAWREIFFSIFFIYSQIPILFWLAYFVWYSFNSNTICQICQSMVVLVISSGWTFLFFDFICFNNNNDQYWCEKNIRIFILVYFILFFSDWYRW